jgi:hypothetical protein
VYVSSLLIVLASSYHTEDLSQLEENQALAQDAFSIFSKLREASTLQPLHQLYSVALGLNQQGARRVITKRLEVAGVAGSSSMSLSDDIASPGNIDLSVLQAYPAEDWSFSVT